MPNKQHKPLGGPGAGGVEPKHRGALKKGQNPRPHFDWSGDQNARGDGACKSTIAPPVARPIRTQGFSLPFTQPPPSLFL